MDETFKYLGDPGFLAAVLILFIICSSLGILWIRFMRSEFIYNLKWRIKDKITDRKLGKHGKVQGEAAPDQDKSVGSDSGGRDI